MESNFSVDDALADVHQAHERLAARVSTPPWYHPTLGLLSALLVFSMSWPWDGRWILWHILAGAGTAIGSGLLIAVYRSRTGLWMRTARSGPRSGRIYWVNQIFIFAMLIVAALGLLTSIPVVIGAVCGVVQWIVTIFFGRRFDDAIRADILAGDASGIMGK